MAINLLPTTKKASIEEGVQKQRVTRVVLSIMVPYLVVVLGVFGYWLFWNIRKGNVENKISEAEARLATQKVKEGSYRLVKEKTSQLLTLLGGTPNALDVWNDVDSLQSDIAVNHIVINGGNVVFSGVTDSSKTLAQLEEALYNTDLFSNLSISGLGKGPGGYSFSIDMSRI